jgi:putative heme transporter
VRPVGLLLLSLVCARIIVGLVGQIDWAAVRDAMGAVSLWQFPVLLVMVAIRQVLNATPLALFIEGLGLRRAVQNDQAATLTSTIAPPPADMVLRLAMFDSWGIPLSSGLAGALMNILTFYATRFSVPVIGLVLVVSSAAPYHAVYTWSACVSAVVAITVLVVLRAVLLRERTAIWVGTTGGRLVRRVRHSVDPEAWAAQAVEFRSHVLQRSRRGLPASLAFLMLMVIVDGLLLAMSLRCVGVGPGDVSTIAVVGIFLLAYPLTLFPLAGVGVLDATLLAAFVEIAGLPMEPDIVAGLLVYRVTTLAVPMLFGLAAVAWWRRTEMESADA